MPDYFWPITKDHCDLCCSERAKISTNSAADPQASFEGFAPDRAGVPPAGPLMPMGRRWLAPVLPSGSGQELPSAATMPSFGLAIAWACFDASLAGYS